MLLVNQMKSEEVKRMEKVFSILFVVAMLLVMPCVYALDNVYSYENDGINFVWTMPKTISISDGLEVSVRFTTTEDVLDLVFDIEILGSKDCGVTVWSRSLDVSEQVSYWAWGTVRKATIEDVYGKFVLPMDLDSGSVYAVLKATWRVNRPLWIFPNYENRMFSDVVIASFVDDQTVAFDEARLMLDEAKSDLILAFADIAKLNLSLSDTKATLTSKIAENNGLRNELRNAEGLLDRYVDDYGKLQTSYDDLLKQIGIPTSANTTTVLANFTEFSTLLKEIKSALGSLEGYDDSNVLDNLKGIKSDIANFKFPDFDPVSLANLWFLIVYGATIIVAVILAICVIDWTVHRVNAKALSK